MKDECHRNKPISFHLALMFLKLNLEYSFPYEKYEDKLGENGSLPPNAKMRR